MKFLKATLFIFLLSSGNLFASPNDIFEAAMLGKEKDVALFLKQGISIEIKDEDGFTPLMLAVLNSNFETLKYLIQQGADINAQDNAKDTALMGACISRNLKVAKFLLKKGADLNVKNIDGASAKYLCKTVSPEIFDYQ